MDVTGNAGDAVNDRITVTGKDDANRDVSDFAEATVNIVNVNPAIDVQKTVKSTGSFAESASLPEPGGAFTYQVVVTNTSSASSDPLDITSLTDDIYHDITTTGHDGITAHDVRRSAERHSAERDVHVHVHRHVHRQRRRGGDGHGHGNREGRRGPRGLRYGHRARLAHGSPVDDRRHEDAVADERPRAGRPGDVLGARDQHVGGRCGDP